MGGVMDRDGDLEGTMPADNLGEHSALVQTLRSSGDYPWETEAADVIEKLSAELTENEKVLNVWRRRTYEAEARLAAEHDAWQAAQTESHKLVEQAQARNREIANERNEQMSYAREIEARLARAEECIEQAPHMPRCRTQGWYTPEAAAEHADDCTCWKADYEKAASDE